MLKINAPPILADGAVNHQYQSSAQHREDDDQFSHSETLRADCLWYPEFPLLIMLSSGRSVSAQSTPGTVSLAHEVRWPSVPIRVPLV